MWDEDMSTDELLDVTWERQNISTAVVCVAQLEDVNTGGKR